MSETKTKAKTITIKGEVTQTPHLVKRKSSKTGKSFNTAAVRYWNDDAQEFGVMSAAFDLALRVVDEASPARKFVASAVCDGEFTNLRDIRWMD